jgi:hypothetical protein
MSGTVATLQSKEQLWDGIGTFPVSPNFFWVTSEGRVLHPKDMRTFHLFAALQIVWRREKGWSNHIQYPRSKRMGRLYGVALANLFNELLNRPDRTVYMEQKCREIAQLVVNLMKKKSKQKVI